MMDAASEDHHFGRDRRCRALSWRPRRPESTARSGRRRPNATNARGGAARSPSSRRRARRPLQYLLYAFAPFVSLPLARSRSRSPSRSRSRSRSRSLWRFLFLLCVFALALPSSSLSSSLSSPLLFSLLSSPLSSPLLASPLLNARAPRPTPRADRRAAAARACRQLRLTAFFLTVTATRSVVGGCACFLFITLAPAFLRARRPAACSLHARCARYKAPKNTPPFLFATPLGVIRRDGHLLSLVLQGRSVRAARGARRASDGGRRALGLERPPFSRRRAAKVRRMPLFFPRGLSTDLSVPRGDRSRASGGHKFGSAALPRSARGQRDRAAADSKAGTQHFTSAFIILSRASFKSRAFGQLHTSQDRAASATAAQPALLSPPPTRARHPQQPAPSHQPPAWAARWPTSCAAGRRRGRRRTTHPPPTTPTSTPPRRAPRRRGAPLPLLRACCCCCAAARRRCRRAASGRREHPPLEQPAALLTSSALPPTGLPCIPLHP